MPLRSSSRLPVSSKTSNGLILTHAKAWVILISMVRVRISILVLVIASLGCSQAARVRDLLVTNTPAPSLTATLSPPTATHTPTLTPLPTPTPLPAARIDSAEIAIGNGDWERALIEYTAALQSSNEQEIQSAALLGIGRTHFLDKDYAAAEQSLQDLLVNFPGSAHEPYAYFFLGQVYAAAGRYIEAADAYLNYMILRPGLVDGYILNLRAEALSNAGDYAAAMIDYRAAMQTPSLIDQLTLEIKVARAHYAMGDFGTALGMYQDIYNRTTSDYVRAQMDYLLGQAFTALGQIEDAYTVYQDAVNNYPTAYDSYQALLVLVNADVPVNELNRGIVDYYAGQYGVAIVAFDRYLRTNPEDSTPANYYNGLSLQALGGYEDAIKSWDLIIQNYPESRFWDQAWEQKAYTQWWFLKDYYGAIQTLLDFVARVPTHSRSAEFLYDAASIAERTHDLVLAAQLWQRVANEYPNDERNFRALYLAGISNYRVNDTSTAELLFQRCLAVADSPGDQAASYFWQAKVNLAQGDQNAAQANFELAASADPTGYYSERARDLLRNREPFQPPEVFDMSVDWASERTQAEIWMTATFDLPPDTDFSDPGPLGAYPQMIRGQELWNLGLYEEARNEFEVVRQSIQDDPVNLYRFANTQSDLGLYRSAILAARQILNLAGMSDASTMNAPVYFNHLRFGLYYPEITISTAINYGFHPLFLTSVIRQESAFEGFVRSSAGARGLMQIIPTTGQELATKLNWPPDYSAEDLYRPLVSITLGADYLATWRDHFNGNLYAALAAYNGGPGNAMQWHDLSGNDLDIFLEVIRFEETRNYIRGIYEIFSIYRRIYDRTP